MRKNTFTKNFITLIFVLLCTLGTQAQVIDKAKILSVQAQTKDGVIIKISTAKDSYKLGEEIVIDYTVRNTNSKTIYLVTNSELELWAKDEVLWLKSPIKFSTEYEPYNYKFIKISPKKIYKGKIMLDSKKIPVDKDYDKEAWKIQVGFAYLFDMDKLNREGRMDDPGDRAKLWIVAERSVTVNVGSLIVEVDN